MSALGKYAQTQANRTGAGGGGEATLRDILEFSAGGDPAGGSIGRLNRHPAVGIPRPHRRFSDMPGSRAMRQT
ncbi:hypothetical protein LQZ19_01150 [Treponema primitia]|uniref:hypothetical protein n=1 Tax=Treponema primitia TaxID=88058 RepID=UPI00397F2D1F